MLVLGSVLAAFGAPADAAGALDAAIDTRVTTQKEAAGSQKRIAAVAEETQAMLLDFQHVTAAPTATASPPAQAPATVEPAPPQVQKAQVQKEAPKAPEVAP